MNLNFGINYPLNKDKNLIKKDLVNKNFTKIINIILTNQPIALSNLNYHKKFIHKIYSSKKELSMKNYKLKKYKSSYFNDDDKLFNPQLSKINIENKENSNTKKNCDKKSNKRSNDSFYILNKRKFSDNLKSKNVPINNTSYQRQKKIIINNQRIESISNYNKSRSFSKSQNLNYSNGSFDIKKILERKFSSKKGENKNSIKKINLTINNKDKNNKFYLIKKRKYFSHDLKTKINLYIQQQKKYKKRKNSNRDNINSNMNQINKYIGNASFSYDRLKKIKKVKNNNNTFTNITTNNSDKDNINMSTKKNDKTTTYCNTNNIHYFTTNFNSSTNITETNNDLFNNNKGSKEKKMLKKKIKLPFHPKSKISYWNRQPDTRKLMIRNNKSEINIPYNRKNKVTKIKKDNSTKNFKLIYLNRNKFEKPNMHNTSRVSNNFIDSYINKNYLNSSVHFRNKISISKNNLYISSKEKYVDKEFEEGIEMNHFRIVSIIQENKKFLRKNDNDDK